MSIKAKIKSIALRVFPHRLATYINFLGPTRYVQMWFAQRLLRINGHVPWPVHWSSIVVQPSKISQVDALPILGHHVGCYIQANNGVQIGRNFRYGPNVHIISANHDLSDYAKHYPSDPIIIGDNCWVGSGAIILAGVTLGNHVVVAAGSVVTKSFPDDVVIAGVPARIVKQLGPYVGDPNYKLLR